MRRIALLNILAFTAVIIFVFWVCAFKIFDADFFWHVTAGRFMRQTGWLITTDPFAYTRNGLPYLANHEWLAQVILSVIFDVFGSTGVILLRGTLVAASSMLILLIGRKNLWIYAPLVMLAALTIRGGAMDRPHLWTWVMVAAFLLISARVLERERMRWKDVAGLSVLQILWVNLHGGAALLGVVITSALVLELIIQQRKISGTTALPFLLVAALMISPLGWENITYIRTLLSDSTTRFIAEWQPREVSAYLKDLWPFWIASLGALALTRKHLVFSILILGVTGYLSRMAYRHEMLLVLAATAITIFQLEDERWRELLQRQARWLLGTAAVASALVVLYANSVNLAFANRYHAHGYGIIDRTARVTEFMLENSIDGPLFNTYNLGAELLYHSRMVFVDGRNVDYGEEFLKKLFAASSDAAAWKELEKQYEFTAALIDIDGKGPLPYVMHLQGWSLVYLDDAVALYVKGAKGGYRFLTPENFLSGEILNDVAHAQAIEAELRRSIKQAPGGLQARLLLARLLIAQGRVVDAQEPLAEALELAPDDYRPYEVSGLLLARAGDFDGAEFAFDEALNRLTSDAAMPIRAYIVRILEGIGQQERARKFR